MRLAIDLGGTNIRIGQVDGGVVINRKSVACPSGESEEKVMQQLLQLIEEMMKGTSVEGIGIGVPSVVDARHGIVYNVNNIPSWKEVRLKARLEAAFSVPVAVNNDSNCFALGEKKFGLGIPYNNMVGITLGTGVGAGIIIDDRLYGGRHTGAGEVGALPYLDADFEAYCSTPFFTKSCGVPAKEVARRASEGNVEAQALWRSFGTHLGQLFKALLFAYDPQAIVVGGGISSVFSLYEKAMWEAMADFPYPAMLRDVKVLVSQNPDISMLGASALLDEPCE